MTSSQRVAAAVLLLCLTSVTARITVSSITEPCAHAEGPVWDSMDDALLYVDIAGHMLHRYDHGLGRLKGLHFDREVSLVVPLKGELNTYAVGVGRDLVKITVDWTQVHENTTATNYSVLASVQKDKPGNRLNDGKADSNGRIWAGTMGPEPVVGEVTPNQGAFFRFTPDAQGDKYDVTTVLQPVSISNGLAWNSNNTLLYYIDTPTRRVDVFDFNLTAGTIANRRTAFDFAANNVSGNPDGMTIDSDDNLWVACFGGWQVVQVDPQAGEVLQRVPIPAERVTSVAIVGSDVSSLYVTTMRKGLTEEQLKTQPEAGAVFLVKGISAKGHSATVGRRRSLGLVSFFFGLLTVGRF